MMGTPLILHFKRKIPLLALHQAASEEFRERKEAMAMLQEILRLGHSRLSHPELLQLAPENCGPRWGHFAMLRRFLSLATIVQKPSSLHCALKWGHFSWAVRAARGIVWESEKTS